MLSHEPENYRFIDTLLEGDMYVDVGASTGEYSIHAAKRHIKVIAIEPSRFSYEPMVNRIKAAGCLDMVIPLQLAVWKHRGKSTFAHYNTVSGGVHRVLHPAPIREDLTNILITPKDLHDIDVITLNDLMPYIGDSYFGIKIDIDGGEFGAIPSGDILLSSTRCKRLMIELEMSDHRTASLIQYIQETLGFGEKERFFITQGNKDLYNVWYEKES